MTEPLKRRNLFPVAAATPEAPAPEAIAAVAARNGFPEVETQPATRPAPAVEATPEQSDKRRRRQPTGRVHQFTTRLRQETLDLIYSEANERNIPIAQVIEEAMAALQPQRNRV